MLQGKVAIITGSTSGIGLGIARSLATAGADIVLNGFGDAREIENLRACFEKEYGVRAHYIYADMRKPDEVAGLIDKTESALGHVDILVNNAGIQHVARVESFPDDKWADIIAINLSSAFYAIKAVLPGMQKRGWGRIVNVASVHGLVGSKEKSAYVASKHGLVGLTKVVALENAINGITCNAVCPGFVLTPLVQKQIDDRAAQLGVTVDEAARAMLVEKQPSQSFVGIDQLGALVTYLCSDSAAQMTGVTLPMDGGWTSQ